MSVDPPSMPSDEYLRRMRGHLPLGDIVDAAFDELLSPLARAKSRRYWSPVCAARIAALRLAERGVRRVLDVGSGPGKFCIVAACAHPELRFHGIEHRAGLAEAAADLGRRLHLRNLEFNRGDVLATSWLDYDGFYFFNPFAENSYPAEDVFDSSVELSQVRLATELRRSAELLSSVRIGAVVVTYHGLSGPIPSSFDLVSEERVGPTFLRTWVKTRCCEEAWYHLEAGDRVSRVTQSYWSRGLRAPLRPA